MIKILSISILFGLITLLIIVSLGYSQPKISREIRNVALNKSFISSIGHNSPHDETLATDGDTTTFFWSPKSPDTGDYFMVDLGQFYPVNRIFILQAIDYLADYVKNGELQHSINGTDWSPIIVANTKRIDCSFQTSVMRYFRIYLTSRQFEWVQIAEMQAFSDMIPDSIYFGIVELGEYLETSITILNEGNENLVVSDISSDQSVFEISDSSFTIAPDNIKKVSILFKPQIVGPVKATLTIHTNDPLNPDINIYVSGVGSVPIIKIISPINNSSTNSPVITVKVITDTSFVDKLEVEVNGILAEINNNLDDYFFSTDVNLVKGKNQIVANGFNDIDMIIGSDTIEINRITTPPIIKIYKPYSGQTFPYGPIEVLGRIEESNDYTLKINDIITNTINDTFKFEMEIDEGINTIKAIAIDVAGNIGEKSRTFYGRPPNSPPGKLKLYLKWEDFGYLSIFPYKDLPENLYGPTIFVDSICVWKYPITGDIDGTNYTFSILVGTYAEEAQFKCEIVLRQKNIDLVLASTPIFIGKPSGPIPYPPYWISPGRKEFNLTGIDPESISGDTLILKIFKLSGNYEGHIYPREKAPWRSDTQHSWIAIPKDFIPPATVADLSIKSKTDTSVTLQWTAPGDDGNSGKTVVYDLRYSTSTIGSDTTAWWTSSNIVASMPKPSLPGSIDSVTVDGLDSSIWYYFAIKTADEHLNWSNVSNVIPCKTPVELLSTEIPKTFKLSQNYPNPFNPETIIKYQLPNNSEVTIKIYNITGQFVKTLVEQRQPAGYYSVSWNKKDERGQNVASGIYFYRIQVKDFIRTKKMLLVQ